MKIIAMTAYNRPTLLYACLQSLSAANKIDNWQIWILIDPSDLVAEIIAVIEFFIKNGLKIKFEVNSAKMGVRRNPYKLLQWCFGLDASLVLYLEDDVIVSRDCLEVAEAIGKIPDFSSNYLAANLLTTTCNSHSVFTVAAAEQLKLKNIFLENKFFSSLGIILNRYQFLKHFEPNWFRTPLKLRSFWGAESDGWDLAINDYLLSCDQLFNIQSLVPRITHQGTHGTHADYDFHQLAYSHIQVLEATADSELISEPNSLDEGFLVQIIKRNDVKNLGEAFEDSLQPYVKSYVNLIHQLTDLQSSSINIEQNLKSQLEATQLKLEKSHLELEQSQSELDQSQSKLKESEFKLETIQLELIQLKSQHEKLQNLEILHLAKIKAMESSKFWRLRKMWFRLKFKLGLKSEE